MHHLARCASYLTKDAPAHAVVAHRRRDLAQVGVICCGHQHLVERAKCTPSKSDRCSLTKSYSKPIVPALLGPSRLPGIYAFSIAANNPGNYRQKRRARCGLVTTPGYERLEHANGKSARLTAGAGAEVRATRQASAKQGKAGRLGNESDRRRQPGDHHRAMAAVEAGDKHLVSAGIERATTMRATPSKLAAAGF